MFAVRSATRRGSEKGSVPATALWLGVSVNSNGMITAAATETTAKPESTKGPSGWRRPAIQPSRATVRVPATPTLRPVAPVCRHNSQSSAATVSAIGTARMRWNVAIHAPGLGMIRRNAGTNPNPKNGNARPRPRPPKMASAAAVGRTSAAPSAAAMNGPVHGVATKAARTPVQKAPTLPPFPARESPPPKLRRWKRPTRFKVIAVANRTRKSMTRGSCN